MSKGCRAFEVALEAGRRLRDRPAALKSATSVTPIAPNSNKESRALKEALRVGRRVGSRRATQQSANKVSPIAPNSSMGPREIDVALSPGRRLGDRQATLKSAIRVCPFAPISTKEAAMILKATLLCQTSPRIAVARHLTTRCSRRNRPSRGLLGAGKTGPKQAPRRPSSQLTAALFARPAVVINATSRMRMFAPRLTGLSWILRGAGLLHHGFAVDMAP